MIWTLLVRRGWIVIHPEHFKQSLIAHLLRIIRYLHCFRMTSLAITYLFIGWIDQRPTGISRNSINHSVYFPKERLDSPETSRSKRRFFHRFITIDFFSFL